MFGVQFYPTPPELVRTLLAKVDFKRVRYALEPSAGKGDIALALKQRGVAVDCVEIDADLRAVLEGRELVVVGHDFLHFETHTRYDLVVMNPPFANAALHLLHSLNLMKNGGQIVCLLNATTLQEPTGESERELVRRLEELGATVDIVEDGFAQAERRTNVLTAMVYVDIPNIEEEDVLGNLRESILNGTQDQQCEESRLAETDLVRSLVRQYTFECTAGVQLIQQYGQLNKYIPFDHEPPRDRLISMKVHSDDDDDGMSMVNKYIRQMRCKYWEMLFGSQEMRKLFTKKIREDYTAQLRRLRSYDFTVANIMQIKIDLSKKLIGGVEEAVVDMFDELTYEHSMDENTNVHYFSGWKTNKACKVGPKVIFPVWGLYESRWDSWSYYKCFSILEELEKVLGYLDSGRTDGDNCDVRIRAAFDRYRKDYAGEWISCKFFEVSLKKKGSVHVRFTDLDLLKKFNIFGARGRNWLPPSYGKRSYEDLDKHERDVVDSFEGKKSYAKTMQTPGFFLAGVQLAALEGARE